MGKQPWRRQLLLATMGLIALLLIGGTLVASFQWISRPFPGFFLHENLTVGPYFLPSWSGWAGRSAGLGPRRRRQRSTVTSARRIVRSR